MAAKQFISVFIEGLGKINFPGDMPEDAIARELKAMDADIQQAVISEVKPQKIQGWHGSPHDFDEFKFNENMGKGEGAQAYGHGGYFGGARETGEQYRRDLSTAPVDFKGKTMLDDADFQGAQGMGLRAARAEGSADKGIIKLKQLKEEAASKSFTSPQDIEDIQNGIDWLENNKQTISVGDRGHLYQVEIDATPDELLDWDKPLSEQPEGVRQAFKSTQANLVDPETGRPFRTQYYPDEMIASDAYDDMSRFSDAGKVSAELKNNGIKGIQYDDAMSRGAEGGTKNYVIFDDKLIDIAKKYGVTLPVAATMMQSEDAQAGGASKIVGKVADLISGSKVSKSPEYQGEHQAPYRDEEGYHQSLDDVTGTYGDDIYSPMAKRYHGGSASANQAIDIIQASKGNPDAKVDIYRAVPYDKPPSKQLAELEKQMNTYLRRGKVPQGSELQGSDWYNDAWDRRAALEAMDDPVVDKQNINARDWVSLTRDYAKQHGESALNGNYKIIKKKVKASDLFNEGYVDEWGFDPKSIAALSTAGLLSAQSEDAEAGGSKIFGKVSDLASDTASRMARAKEQGFDVDTPYYRGSLSDETMAGEGSFDDRVYSSSNPTRANRYAKRNIDRRNEIITSTPANGVTKKEFDTLTKEKADAFLDYQRIERSGGDARDSYKRYQKASKDLLLKSQKTRQPEGGNISKLYAAGKIKNVDVKGEQLTDKEFKGIMSNAQNEGFDHVKFDNIADDPVNTNDSGFMDTLVTINKPKIRSAHAEFNPANKGKPDLMGAADPKLLGGIAALTAAGAAGAPYVMGGLDELKNIANIDPSVAAKYGLSPNLGAIEGARHPFLSQLADYAREAESPIGGLYDATANVLDSLAYGDRPEFLDVLLSPLEVLDPYGIPALIAGSGRRYLEQQQRQELQE